MNSKWLFALLSEKLDYFCQLFEKQGPNFYNYIIVEEWFHWWLPLSMEHSMMGLSLIDLRELKDLLFYAPKSS